MTPQEAPNASWINPELYPFKTYIHKSPVGDMRYVDVGHGDPLVMVHGNPVWSFVYRKLISGLQNQYWCIAPDHIGFGQSDKPYDWSYTPPDHAKNLAHFLDSLDLHNITLVVQDWGGPTGLSYAIANPHRMKQLVILNTWLWSVKDVKEVGFFPNISSHLVIGYNHYGINAKKLVISLPYSLGA